MEKSLGATTLQSHISGPLPSVAGGPAVGSLDGMALQQGDAPAIGTSTGISTPSLQGPPLSTRTSNQDVKNATSLAGELGNEDIPPPPDDLGPPPAYPEGAENFDDQPLPPPLHPEVDTKSDLSSSSIERDLRGDFALHGVEGEPPASPQSTPSVSPVAVVPNPAVKALAQQLTEGLETADSKKLRGSLGNLEVRELLQGAPLAAGARTVPTQRLLDAFNAQIAEMDSKALTGQRHLGACRDFLSTLATSRTDIEEFSTPTGSVPEHAAKQQNMLKKISGLVNQHPQALTPAELASIRTVLALTGVTDEEKLIILKGTMSNIITTLYRELKDRVLTPLTASLKIAIRDSESNRSTPPVSLSRKTLRKAELMQAIDQARQTKPAHSRSSSLSGGLVEFIKTLASSSPSPTSTPVPDDKKQAASPFGKSLNEHKAVAPAPFAFRPTTAAQALADPVMRTAFQEFLKSEHTIENYNFLAAVAQYKSHPTPKAAREIYRKHVALEQATDQSLVRQSSGEEQGETVNLSSQNKKALDLHFAPRSDGSEQNEFPATLFNPAESEILDLVTRDNLRRFITKMGERMPPAYQDAGSAVGAALKAQSDILDSKTFFRDSGGTRYVQAFLRQDGGDQLIREYHLQRNAAIADYLQRTALPAGVDMRTLASQISSGTLTIASLAEQQPAVVGYLRGLYALMQAPLPPALQTKVNQIVDAIAASGRGIHAENPAVIRTQVTEALLTGYRNLELGQPTDAQFAPLNLLVKFLNRPGAAALLA